MSEQRYSRLLVLGPAPSNKKHPRVFVRCDCGAEKSVYRQSLAAGLTQSCGCLGKERRRAANTKHGQGGLKRSGAYSSWAGMMDRCEWGGHPSYAQYGGKGIRVCERWHSFVRFLEDMGARPPGCSIDRIDGTLGYGPLNCRWATRAEQNLNTIRNHKVWYRGEILPAAALCDRLGLSRKAIQSRATRRGGDWVAALQSAGVECRAP
jgi:hypothetical protein